jgi:hypothetical protein
VRPAYLLVRTRYTYLLTVPYTYRTRACGVVSTVLAVYYTVALNKIEAMASPSAKVKLSSAVVGVSGLNKKPHQQEVLFTASVLRIEASFAFKKEHYLKVMCCTPSTHSEHHHRRDFLTK